MKGTYELKIDYAKNTRHPEKIFDSMSDLLIKLRELDQIMVESLPEISRIEIELENIEIGSIKTRIKSVIETIPDAFLENLDWKNLIGAYLVRAKYYIISKLSEKDSLTSSNETEEIINEIKKIGKEEIGKNVNISQHKLLTNISGLSSVMKNLDATDKVIFISSEGAIELNKKFDLKISQIEELMSAEMKTLKLEKNLRIKKPDYIGESKWDFYLDSHVIKAKILDIQWLEEFQNGTIDLRPKDALNVKLKAIYMIDNNGNKLNEEYEIIKVNEIIKFENYEQINFE